MRMPTVVVALATGLTIVSGAADAFTYLVVGKVFSSAVTGNLALLGIAVSGLDPTFIAHVVGALAAYGVGAAAGGYIIRGTHGDDEEWPPQATVAFVVELALLVAFLVVWLVIGARPEPATLWVLLVLAALAMGLQSGAYRAMHINGVLGSTYLSGNFVVWMMNLRTGRPDWPGAVSVLGLVVGAVVEAVLLAQAPLLAGAFPAVVLAAVVAVAASSRFRTAEASSADPAR